MFCPPTKFRAQHIPFKLKDIRAKPRRILYIRRRKCFTLMYGNQFREHKIAITGMCSDFQDSNKPIEAQLQKV